MRDAATQAVSAAKVGVELSASVGGATITME
jgi:hypothetical protein